MDKINFTLILVQVSANLCFLDKQYAALLDDDKIKHHCRAKEIVYTLVDLQGMIKKLIILFDEKFKSFLQSPIQTPNENDKADLKDIMQKIIIVQKMCQKTLCSFTDSKSFEQEMFVAKSVESLIKASLDVF